MPDLTEEEKKILRQAYEIKERIKAEELEAGEVSVDEAVDEDLSTDKHIQRQRKQTRPKPNTNTANETSPVDERSIYGPEASNEAIKKAPEIEKKMPVPEAEKKKRPKQTKSKGNGQKGGKEATKRKKEKGLFTQAA